MLSAKLICCLKAVSYTHLDVYKRQVLIRNTALPIKVPITAPKQTASIILSTVVIIFLLSLCQEIILIITCKIILCTGLAAKRLSVLNLLEIIQSTRNTLISVRVKGIEVNGCTAIHTAVYLAAVNDRLTVIINNAGCRCTVGIDEVCICICLVIRTLRISCLLYTSRCV